MTRSRELARWIRSPNRSLRRTYDTRQRPLYSSLKGWGHPKCSAISSLITLLFGAIYKVLPDKRIEWHDVLIGAFVTAFLFTVGKLLISLYIGSTAIASSYGAAGSLIVVLLWIYYSAQIFLLGAEFTKVYASHHGSHQRGQRRLLEQGS
jgi:uncharacterized BrkB/YihY/UPF0761 family membrane protein